jgi:hypothetical protein
MAPVRKTKHPRSADGEGEADEAQSGPLSIPVSVDSEASG